MLQYNLKRIFKFRAIDKPYTYLTLHGFSSNFASKVVQNKLVRMNNREIEHMCLILRCTPSDLFEWIPDEGSPVDENHPMNKLKTSGNEIDFNKSMRSVPMEKMDELRKIINEKIKEYEQPGQTTSDQDELESSEG